MGAHARPIVWQALRLPLLEKYRSWDNGELKNSLTTQLNPNDANAAESTFAPGSAAAFCVAYAKEFLYR
jgi:hypothetical protein